MVILKVRCMASMAVEYFSGVSVEDALSKLKAHYTVNRETASALWKALHVFPCDHENWRLFQARVGRRWGRFLLQHINDEE